MVQVGNEIRTGMLWPDGRLGTPPNEHGSDFDRLAELLKAGIRGVHDARQEADPDGTKGLPPVRIALHLDNGGDNALYRWWFDEIVKRDVPFRSEEHTSELQSREKLVCRLLPEKKKSGRTSN